MGDRHPTPSAEMEDNVDNAPSSSHDDHDTHYQRVSISGEDTSGVPMEDLDHASRLIIQALQLREKYMDLSQQSFAETTAHFLKSVLEKNLMNNIQHEDRKTIAGKLLH